MLHVGSALGLLIYFWRDWIKIITALFSGAPWMNVGDSGLLTGRSFAV